MTPHPSRPPEEQRDEPGRLALSVFEQIAGRAIEGLAEFGERLGVDAVGFGFAHEVVDGLARQARFGGESVAREPRPLGHVFEFPAYRHGVMIAFTSTLDKRQRSVYYSPVLQRERSMADTILHPFERAGLGLAPFRCTSVVDTGRVSRGCQYCGTGIRIVCNIKSRDGKSFVVGTDCVAKTCISVDTTLALDVRKEVARLKREKAEARRQRDWERLQERIASARSVLASRSALLTSQPHPFSFLAVQGKTLRDYCEWRLANAGMAGRADACRTIEEAANV